MNRPHVIILGAGASRAALPNGDKYGRKLPIMNDLIDIIQVREIFENFDIEPAGNFEVIYGELCKRDKRGSEVERINFRLWDYFSRIDLPDYPTIYDHLVLSLTKKDVIATFNWDPLLYNASVRNSRTGDLPSIIYLHGNVACGYCLEHRVMGLNGGYCKKCGKLYTPSKLLYPIENKNYSEDKFLKAQWQELHYALKSAYILTIFGYSAPSSDVEAVNLMQNAWGSPEQREYEEIEIIDIKDGSELADTWSGFIHSHHYRTCNNFYDSFLASFPTKSCEMMWEQLMEVKYLDYGNKIPLDSDFDELLRWREKIQTAGSEKH